MGNVAEASTLCAHFEVVTYASVTLASFDFRCAHRVRVFLRRSWATNRWFVFALSQRSVHYWIRNTGLNKHC
jgi:hypothetical protein